MRKHRKRPSWFEIGILVAVSASPWASRSESSTQALEASVDAPTVIMISLDGTRPGDVTAASMPRLDALARRGARAEGLTPPTPANTFPSHVTLVTGVAPETHGIVNNYFIDPKRGVFRRKQIPTWIEVEPLWSYLAGEGVTSASYHWVGSEGEWRSGRGPRYWQPFSSATSASQKVEQILAWLDLPDPDRRPHFITAWFHGADHAGHVSGPGSDEALRALRRQDPAIETLVAGIKDRGLWPSTTLLIVSDHGMAAATRRIRLSKEFSDRGMTARVFGAGGFAGVYLDSDFGRATDSSSRAARDDAMKRVQEVARELGLEAVLRARAAPSLRLGNPRFGDVVIRAPIGTAIYREELPAGGFHGYASDTRQMQGIFIAFGRGVRPGTRLPLLRGVDVAPSVLRLLGRPIPDYMEGRAIAGIDPLGDEIGAPSVQTSPPESARLLPSREAGPEPDPLERKSAGGS